MCPKKIPSPDIVWPMRKAISDCKFERQHTIVTNFYNYVDITGTIEIWEEIWTPGIRIIFKDRGSIMNEVKDVGLSLHFPSWKPHPFHRDSIYNIELKDLTSRQFIAVMKLMPVAKKLACKIKKYL